MTTATRRIGCDASVRFRRGRASCVSAGCRRSAPESGSRGRGARVTVLDNSPRQLEQDELVAQRDNLPLRTVLGDMRDLSAFAGSSFDLVFNPVSNLFIPELAPA